MGTFANSAHTGANNEFRVNPFGLDLGRCRIQWAPGHWVADSAATFRQGQFVQLNSSGRVIVSGGNDFLGIAKHAKTTAPVALAVDEAVTFSATGATVTLAHTGISDVVVFSAVEQGGTRYTVTTDYTLNTTNGTITHVGAAGITAPATVYVSYTYSLTSAQMQQDGLNFFNSADDVSLQNGRVTVIMGQCTIYTTEFEKTGRTYALTGTGSNLYVNSSGILPMNPTSNKFVGKVIELPTAKVPYLGCLLDLAGVAAT